MMNLLIEEAERVYTAQTLTDKKNELKNMVNNMNHPNKDTQLRFLHIIIPSIKGLTEADTITSNLVLRGLNLGVIK